VNAFEVIFCYEEESLDVAKKLVNAFEVIFCYEEESLDVAKKF